MNKYFRDALRKKASEKEGCLCEGSFLTGRQIYEETYPDSDYR